jgi:hypothetical protein
VSDIKGGESAEENIWTEMGLSDRRVEKMHDKTSNLYYTPSIIRMIKSGNIRFVGHVD